MHMNGDERGSQEDEMKNRNITEDLKKVIAVIQTIEGKKVWILNIEKFLK